MENFRYLFSPLTVKGKEIKNRIYQPALVMGLSDEEGNVTPEISDFYVKRAKGGVGLIVIGGVYADRRGKGYYGMLAMDRDDLIEQYKKLIDAMKPYGTISLVQIMDTGRYARSKVSGLEPVAPSAVPCKLTGQTPKEMTIDEVEEYKGRIVKAVKRAALAGFDGVEFHAGMGYLINQFLSSFTNRRNDEYGGDIKARMKFLVEIIEESKEVVPPDFVIGCRVSMHDFMEGGNTEREGEQIVRKLDELGVDIISVVVGWHESKVPLIVQEVPPAGYIRFAEMAKKVTNKPVVYTIRVKDPSLANRIIAEGRADMVGVARALIADPDWPDKAKNGMVEEIRPCITCSHCLSSLFSTLIQGTPKPVECQVNPRLGKESIELPTVEYKKRILVIGGGPAGLEAALTLAKRGHEVILIEKEDEIGGLIIPASTPKYKQELLDIVKYYRVMLNKSGVKIILNRKADRKFIKSLGVNEIIVATGATARKLKVMGAQRSFVLNAIEVLRKRMELSGRIVVCGGGETGLEVADFLSEHGAKVRVVEMYVAGQKVEFTERGPLFRRLKEKGVEIIQWTKLKSIEEGKVTIEDKDGNSSSIPCDYVVNAIGEEPNLEILKEIDKTKYKVHFIGDCVRPRRIGDAIREGFEAGIKI